MDWLISKDPLTNPFRLSLSILPTQTSTVVLGFTSLAQLIVTSDLLALFSKASSHFPSTEVKHVLIYTLIVAVWTFVLSLLLPFAYRDAAIYGTSNSAASNSLFVTLLLETVGSVAPLARPEVKGVYSRN